jgi:putative Ca2+/H+ antiporter (TMEM165/GDT1 family)
LAAVYVPGLNSSLAPYYKPIVILVGAISLFFGVYGFIVAGNPVPNTFGYNLESPADNLLHLVVGAWALWAAMRKQPMVAKPAM